MKYPPIPFKVKVPTGFNWNGPSGMKITRMPNGKFKTNIDVSQFKFQGKNYYVDVNNGSDSNDGLTLQTPFKSIAKAMSAHGNIKPTVYGANVTMDPSNDWCASGSKSWKVTTPGTIASEGYRSDLVTVNGRSYTITAKVKVPLNATMELKFGGTSTSFTGTGTDQIVTTTQNASATTTTLGVRTKTTAQAITFYVDELTVIDNVTGLNILSGYQSTAEDLVINLADGFYNKTDGFNNTSLGINTAIIGLSGSNPIISAENSQTYSLSSGQTNTYQSTEASQVYRVFDSKTLDIYGDYTEYTKKTSIAEVEATPGSWYWASNILYVHTLDNREPDTDIHPYLPIKQVYANACDVYLEGLTILGGGSTTGTSGPVYSASTTPVYNLYMKNCTVKYSCGVNPAGNIALNKSNAILQNCLASKSFSDGFNYHNSNNVIEINCIGRDNGVGTGLNTNNGSSMHDNGKIIRINGEYMRNGGPNVVDVTVGTLSWNLGVIAHDSKAGAATISRSDFYAQCDSMWLDNCKSYGSLYGIGCDGTEPLGTMYLRQTKESVQRITGGNISEY